MTDITLQTARYAFQKIGTAQTIEPRDFNAMLDSLDLALVEPPRAASGFTGGTGVAITAVYGNKIRLTLTAASVSVTTALKYGSLKILTWPNTNLVVKSARMNLIGTKGNAGSGLVSSATPKVGVGSAAASNTTLATTMVDTIEQVQMAGAALAEAVQSNGPHTAGDRFIVAGATNYLYLNVGTALNSADDVILFSGTVDVFFQDFGLFS